MFLAIFALYPFVKKDVKRFGSYAAPLIAITIYAYISQNFKCIDYAQPFAYITTIGTLRALAAISLGVMAYTVIDNFKTSKIQLTKRGNFIIRILCCVLFILLTTMMTIKTFSRPRIATDMCFIFYLFIFFIFLQISTGRISFLDNKLTRFLATLSLPLYLNHRVWLYLLSTKYEYLNLDTKLLIYFSASFLTALISIPIAKFVDKGFKKLGNIIFEEEKP
jgi:peptidoglycan/LPS O-acetylase OafA/YrhL